MTERLGRVQLLALDVDGTLTDGGIAYTSDGTEHKRFHSQDGLGIVLARQVGLQVALITGRESPIVTRRASELGIPTHLLLQGVRDKDTALAALATSLGLTLEQVAFMGDDLNDLPAMRIAGIALAPADAAGAVLTTADWVAPRDGGHGAVRCAIEAILAARGDLDEAISLYLKALAPGQ